MKTQFRLSKLYKIEYTYQGHRVAGLTTLPSILIICIIEVYHESIILKATSYINDAIIDKLSSIN